MPNSILTVLSLFSISMMSAFSLVAFAERSAASAPAFAFAFMLSSIGA